MKSNFGDVGLCVDFTKVTEPKIDTIKGQSPFPKSSFFRQQHFLMQKIVDFPQEFFFKTTALFNAHYIVDLFDDGTA